MIIDLSKYRAIQLPLIKIMLDRKEPEDREKELSNVALVTGCHVLVCAHYIGELYGFTPTLQTTIASISKFYRITDVVGLAEPVAQ